MGIDGGGAGVLLALAAVMWMAYLVPTWFKRREYLATERNAIRLQQTLRILAESAEVPQTVHAEANARSIAEQQRALRMEAQRAASALKAQDAVAARASAERMAASQPELARHISAAGALPRRVRRTRGLLATALVLAVGVALVQATMLLAGAGGAAAWLVLAFAGFVGVSSTTLLARLGGVARAKAARASAASRTRRRAATPVQDVRLERTVRTWTPVDLPKPLYLTRAQVERPVMADPREDQRLAAGETQRRVIRMEAAAAVAAAAARVAAEQEAADARAAEARLAAEARAVMEAQSRAQVEPAVVAAPPSRFASMGRIDLTGGSAPDLDQALRRRRAV